MKNRLEELSEAVLPDSQCGFRSRRGCVDIVFVIRQLIEKTIEHDSSLYILFVDLKKAYDSILRDCLWRVLEKLGVPPTVLSIIRSLHEGMQAVVCVAGTVTEQLQVNNSLRQGCTLSPTLFVSTSLLLSGIGGISVQKLVCVFSSSMVINWLGIAPQRLGSVEHV